jgi:hypothetical protein
METKTFNFIYEDGKYMTFELTDQDEENLEMALTTNLRPILMYRTKATGSFISLQGLRFVVPFVEEEPTENASATPPEFELDEFLYRKKADEREEDIEDDDGEPI